MRSRTILFIAGSLFVCLSVTACEQPTNNFQRENENDPLSQNYSGDLSVFISTTFNEEGIITIEWENENQFEDGFIIEKSLADSLSFAEIGRVSRGVTTFKDSSKKVRKKTFYKVTAFIKKDNELKNIGSQIQQIKFLGEIDSFNHNFNSEFESLDLNWKTSSPFATKFQLEYRKGKNNNFSVLKEFGAGSTFYKDKMTDISFDNREYRLSLLLTGENFEDKIDQKTIKFKSTAFNPSELTFEFQNEQTITLNWKDNSYFEDGFKIFRSTSQNNTQMELIESVPANTSEYHDEFNLENGSNYFYKVLAYTSKSESDSILANKKYTIPTPNLINDRYSNTASSSINIFWEIEDDKLVNKFILERQQNSNDPWLKVGEFDKKVRNYTDSGLDPAKGYRYRIRTISSDYSSNLPLYYRTLYNKIATFVGHTNQISDLDFSPEGNFLASSSNYALGYGDEYINIWDLDTKQLFKQIDSRDEPITSVHFSDDGTMVASGSWFDHKVKVFEFPSGDLLNSFNEVDAYDVKFSPDSKFIAATGGFADVRKWNIETGDLIFHYEGNGSPTSTFHSLAYNPNGSSITVDDDGVVVLDAFTGQLLQKVSDLRGYSSHPNNVGYSSDGSKLVFTIGSMQAYETTSWNRIFNVPPIDIYQDNRHGKLYPKFHPNDNSIVAASKSYKINFRNIDTNEILNRLSVSRRISYFTISPNGRKVAIGFEDSTIELWEESNQKGWKKVIPYDLF